MSAPRDPEPTRASSHWRLVELYQRRFSERERRQRRELWSVLCRDFFSAYVGTHDTVLDLGAGLCDFINQIPCSGQRFALDLSPEVEVLAGPGVTALVGDAADLPSFDLPPLDVVFASNVFEHVRSKDTLIEVLRGVHTALRPGGTLLVMQPNLRYVGGEYWDFLDHHIPLTDRSMAELFGLTGFEVVEQRPRFLPYSTKGILPQHPLLVRLYLRCRPAHWLLGKQMFLVGRRLG